MAEDNFIEYEEYLKAQIRVNKGAALAIFLSLPTVLLIAKFFNLRLPFGVMMSLALFAVIISAYVYLLSKSLKEKKNPENITLWYLSSNAILYSLIIHYLGGLEGIGMLLYFFIIVEANILLPRKKGIVVTFFSIISFATVGFLECFMIIPHYDIFLTGPSVYNNINYLLFVIFIGGVLGLNYVGVVASNFSGVYRKTGDMLIKERQQIMSVQAQLEEAKEVLEVKINARTKKLKQLKEQLEITISNKREELKDKVSELENFQRLVVGREVRLKELEKELKKKKKQEL